MSYVKPTLEDFKAYFVRDFPFGTNIDEHVLDSDIQKAMLKADAFILTKCFSSQEMFSLGYYFLTAHYLVLSLRASSQGINGKYEFLQTSRSVGSVSEGVSIPESISKNPLYMSFMQSNYGGEYLNMVLPCISTAVFVTEGRTTP